MTGIGAASVALRASFVKAGTTTTRHCIFLNFSENKADQGVGNGEPIRKVKQIVSSLI